MKKNYIRHIYAYGDDFIEFKKTVDKEVLKKIYFVFELIMSVQDVPATFLKHLEDGLYEIRVTHGGNAYRIFCCFDEGNLVILFNAFQKKTQKTPSHPMGKAKRLMAQYFKEKKESNEKD